MSYIPAQNVLSHFLWRYKYLPKEENKTPIYMYQMVDHYLNAGSHTKNIQAFRGSGKSINTCILALERVATGHNRFVMIVSDTMTQAEALIADIQTLCDDGSIPIKVTRSITGAIEFDVNGKAACIMGVGAGMSLRGRKFKRMRADLVITDDLMNDAVALNRLRMDRLSRWMFKVLIPSMQPDAELWNVGTPLNQGDIFMKMCENHPTLQIKLEPGVWDDRFTPEWIKRKKAEYDKAGMLRAWKQEMELILVDNETQLFDMDQIEFIEEMPKDVMCVMAIDAAISDKAGSDFTGITINGIDKDGNWNLYPLQLKLKPSYLAGEIIELVVRFNILYVGIEQGATCIALTEHLNRLRSETNVWFNIEELKHGGYSKIARAKSFEPVVASGIVKIIDNGDGSEALVEQMELTDNEGINSAHDDVLDSTCYLTQMVKHYTKYADADAEEEDYDYRR